MKVRLEEAPGGAHSKLACVKRVKELTGKGLKEAKEVVDRCSDGEHVEFDVKFNRGDIERMKTEFDIWGYRLSGGRSEAIEDLLGDMYKYVIEYLHRDVTYKIEEGSVDIRDGRYEFTIDIGIKLDDTGERSINNRKITLPIDSVSLEENTMLDD